MPRLQPQDRLQPSLLDRLTDDEPTQRRESADRQVLTMQELRQCVLRDLTWLLNTGNLDAVEDLERYPEVAASTLNYGIPHLAGIQPSRVEAREMEIRLREAIWRFEPRILRDTVQVRLTRDDTAGMPMALTFDIEGMLWAEPVPWHLYLRTAVDLELGTFTITGQDERDET